MNLHRHQHVPVCLRSMVTGPTSVESVGMTVNLSKMGCLFESASQVEPGMAVTLRINVPGKASSIHITQATVRRNLVGKTALGFITVAPSEQARLDQLLDRMNHDQQTRAKIGLWRGKLAVEIPRWRRAGVLSA